MKKAFLLFGLVVVVFTSCFKEDADGCPAVRNLLFTHYCEYDPNTEFDNWIANDVALYVYQDDKLAYKKHIAYGDIRGGKAYSYRKRLAGDLQIVAWAIPKEGAHGNLPEWNYERKFSSIYLEMNTGMRSRACVPFEPYLYLGRVTVADDNIMEDSTHIVKMMTTACQLFVNVYDAQGVIADESMSKYAVIDGTKTKMDLDYRGFEDEANVYAPLQTDSNGKYTTNCIGIFPSDDLQTIDVNVVYGDRVIAKVKTNQKAVSGGRIIVDITLGIGVTVTINGWEIVIDDVEWV